MRNKLTAIQVKNAGDGKHYDGGGLVLARSKGAGKWVYRYSHLGRRRDMGLGSQNDLTLADARKARDKWAAVLASGEDPISVRDAQTEAAKADRDKHDPTFAEMVQITFDAKKATLRGGGKRGRWRSPLDLYMIPALGRKRMSAIHQADIKAALSKIWGKKHPTAVKAIQRTRIVFKQAQLIGIACDPFTVDAARHMLGEVQHKAVHVKALPWQEVPSLYAQLTDQTPVHLCLRWCILTLARSNACRAARFEEVADAVWTVPEDRVKGRQGKVDDFRVPLSVEAQAVVRAATELSDGYLFAGLTKGFVSDQGVTKALQRIAPDATIHGFRTSFRTWVQDTDACSYEVAETVLGHTVGGKVERSYARSDLLDRRRIVMDKWAAYVTGAGADVVKLRG